MFWLGFNSNIAVCDASKFPSGVKSPRIGLIKHFTKISEMESRRLTVDFLLKHSNFMIV